MANSFIYSGLAVMLLGAVFGIFVAVKGFRETEWTEAKRISIRGSFTRGYVSPRMKKLIRIWVLVMIAGFLITGIGLAIGLG